MVGIAEVAAAVGIGTVVEQPVGDADIVDAGVA